MNKDLQRVALVVGAGAVENAWQPVLTALSSQFDFDIDYDSANCYFARLVYLMRFYATIGTSDSKAHLKEILDFVNNLKKTVAEELLKAEKNGSIKARPELKSILETFILSETNESVLITTNWDTVIENQLIYMGNQTIQRMAAILYHFTSMVIY